MNYEFFHNRFDMWEHLQKECSGLDFNKTLMLPIMYFADQEREYHCGNMVEFVNTLNTRFKTKYSPTHSYRNGQKCVLFYKENDESENKLLVDANHIIKKEDLEVDWDMIDKLENTPEDKKTLDKYAEDNFGISLKRNKKLVGMVEDFKSELEKL